jgi:GNAT superfamily N-acetyltransferase
VPLLNLALGCDFPADTPDTVIDAEIASVIAFFAQRGVPWYWWIGATPSPPDIGERVKKHGLSVSPPPLPAMAAPLVGTPFEITDPTITVWQASTTADLVAASLLRRTAFRFPDGIATDYFEAMADDWLHTPTIKLYLARLDDHPPAAIGALIMGDNLPGVYVMATLPEWGRRGLGKAILTRIMNDAIADQHRMIVLTASRFGFPLYQQFGFERLFDYSIYWNNTSA